MPFVRLQTNESLAIDVKKKICAELSRTIAESIKKPERYVMAVIDDDAFMLHGGEGGPAAFIEVHSIGGLSPEVNQTLSERLCKVTAKLTTVAPARIFLNFVDVAATDWGHDGKTFG